ncbi:hypothetical protein ABZP36_018185 [Zizania latifolia]
MAARSGSTAARGGGGCGALAGRGLSAPSRRRRAPRSSSAAGKAGCAGRERTEPEWGVMYRRLANEWLRFLGTTLDGFTDLLVGKALSLYKVMKFLFFQLTNCSAGFV